MRDPDLVFRAQLAAAALEGAWHRWRVVHGLTADPVPTVSSYVGYSLEEPWGQPRVVFGLGAEDAEQLATLLERHDCVGPVYAAVATLPGAREAFTRPGPGGPEASWLAPLPVPRQAPSADAERTGTERYSGERYGGERYGGGDPFDTVVDLVFERPFDGAFNRAFDGSFDRGDLGEPVYRQAAAAMQEAAAARQRADQAADEAADEAEDGSPGQAGRADSRGAPAAGIAGPGSLAKAASAARAEAEVRIRAALAEYRKSAERDFPYPTVDFDRTDDPFAPGRPKPEVHATDVLEPLPRPEVASGAYSPSSGPDEEDGSAGGSTSGSRGTDGRGDAESPAERRGRAVRGYPLSRLSRPKRSGS